MHEKMLVLECVARVCLFAQNVSLVTIYYAPRLSAVALDTGMSNMVMMYMVL